MVVNKLKNIDINFILKNEQHYRNIIRLHLLERNNNIDDLGIKKTKSSNTKDKEFINKLEDKRYLQAKVYINAIDKFINTATETEVLVYELKFKHRYTIQQLAFRCCYSRSSIYNILKNIRDKVTEYIKQEIENQTI